MVGRGGIGKWLIGGIGDEEGIEEGGEEEEEEVGSWWHLGGKRRGFSLVVVAVGGEQCLLRRKGLGAKEEEEEAIEGEGGWGRWVEGVARVVEDRWWGEVVGRYPRVHQTGTLIQGSRLVDPGWTKSNGIMDNGL